MTQWIKTSRLHQDGTPVARKIKLSSYSDPVWFTDQGYAEVSDSVADILASTLGDISKVSEPVDPGEYYGDMGHHETIQVNSPDGVFDDLITQSMNADSVHTEYVDTPLQQFTVGVLPDTQVYTNQDNGLFEQQAQWLANNSDDLDLEMVLHLGDLVEHGDDNAGEWDIAETAIGTLEDAGIPTLLAFGNHDANDLRDPTTYRSRFPASRYDEMVDNIDSITEAGTYEGYTENAYLVQEMYGETWLWITVEIYPRDEVLNWVDTVLSNHEDATATIATHAYLNPDGSRVEEGDSYSPTSYFDAGADWNTGVDMWDTTFSQHENVANVINGHFLDSNYADNISAGDNGNLVTETFVNYQTESNGGDGWLRLMQPNVKRDVVDVRTYSPSLDEWSNTDGESFDFDLWEYQTKTVPRGVTPDTDYQWTELDGSPWTDDGSGSTEVPLNISDSSSHELYMMEVAYHPGNVEGGLSFRVNDVADGNANHEYINFQGQEFNSEDEIPLELADSETEVYRGWMGRIFVSQYHRPMFSVSESMATWSRTQQEAHVGYYDSATDISTINFSHATDPGQQGLIVRVYRRNIADGG